MFKHPFLGFSAPAKAFGLTRAASYAPVPVLHEGKAHCLSIGQTGSGKTNLMIANLLLWEGSAIVIDVRGDAMRATARFRRDVLKQKVFMLDPFGAWADRLDPLELANLPRADHDAEAQTIGSLLAAPYASTNDAYWHLEGANLIAGIAAYLMASAEPHSMNRLAEMLFDQDCDYKLAQLLDSHPKESDAFWFQSISAYLQIPDSNNGSTRSCVISTARTLLQPFRCRAVQGAMGPSTVDLKLLLEGKPVTIYLVLPIERLVSHAMVLGLWLEILCQTLLRRTKLPELPTLLLVDECGQFGCVSTALKLVSVYMRGQGVKLWTMFQDIGQIKTMFGTDFSTFINSNSAITVLPGTGLAAREAESVLGIQGVGSLGEDEQLVYEVGKETRTVKMAQYWRDPLFAGRFDELERFRARAKKTSHSR